MDTKVLQEGICIDKASIYLIIECRGKLYGVAQGPNDLDPIGHFRKFGKSGELVEQHFQGNRIEYGWIVK